jgi:acetyl-CoA synthetase
MTAATPSARAFRAARDFLLAHPADDAAAAGFPAELGPELTEFNWALDWFDRLAGDPGTRSREALWIVEEDGFEGRWTFAGLSVRSNKVANWLWDNGVRRGDRILVMLGLRVELWETVLAAMKLGAVVIPATTGLEPDELAARTARGDVRFVVAEAAHAGKFAEVAGSFTCIAVDGPVRGWRAYAEAYAEPDVFHPDQATPASDPLLLSFREGTSAEPVEHTHGSVPVHQLSTMYRIGLEPGDVHLNVPAPGESRHTWDTLFAPWNAEATVFVLNGERFDAERLLSAMDRGGVTSLCAPAAVWHMLSGAELEAPAVPPDKAVCPEPVEASVREKIRARWGVTIRDAVSGLDDGPRGHGMDTTVLAG